MTTVLDQARLRLRIAGGQWPAAPQSGLPSYTAPAQKLLEAGQVAACAQCGDAMPGDPTAGWQTCEPCTAGVEAHRSRWPLAAVLERLRRGADGLAVARVLARTHRALELPAWQEIPAAAPGRPIKPWSQAGLTVPPDRLVLRNGTPAWTGVRVEGEIVPGRGSRRPMARQRVELVDGWRWPTWSDVARTCLVQARNVEDAEAIVSPLTVWPELGWAGCAWCGQSEVARRWWMLVDGKPWCGVVSDCPRPNVGVPAANRAAAVNELTDKPADLQLIDRLHRAGRLPKPLLWSDLPDADRVPYDGPWGWWSDDDVDALEAVLDEWAAPNDEHVADALRRGRADAEFADRAQAARDAELAEIRAEAVEAARAEAAKQPPARPPSLTEAIAEEVGKAIAPAVGRELIRRNREAKGQQTDPLGNPVGPGRRRRR